MHDENTVGTGRVMTSAGMATVVFDRETNRVISVEFLDDGQPERNALDETVMDVKMAIEDPRHMYAFSVDQLGTPFQHRVWNALCAVPLGSTVSYKELAHRVGSGPRAVAKACASNRVAVLVPCHRAVASDGSLRGYRWGLERKRALLEFEQRRF